MTIHNFILLHIFLDRFVEVYHFLKAETISLTCCPLVCNFCYYASTWCRQCFTCSEGLKCPELIHRTFRLSGLTRYSLPAVPLMGPKWCSLYSSIPEQLRQEEWELHLLDVWLAGFWRLWPHSKLLMILQISEIGMGNLSPVPIGASIGGDHEGSAFLWSSCWIASPMLFHPEVELAPHLLCRAEVTSCLGPGSNFSQPVQNP